MLSVVDTQHDLIWDNGIAPPGSRDTITWDLAVPLENPTVVVLGFEVDSDVGGTDEPNGFLTVGGQTYTSDLGQLSGDLHMMWLLTNPSGDSIEFDFENTTGEPWPHFVGLIQVDGFQGSPAKAVGTVVPPVRTDRFPQQTRHLGGICVGYRNDFMTAGGSWRTPVPGLTDADFTTVVAHNRDVGDLYDQDYSFQYLLLDQDDALTKPAATLWAPSLAGNPALQQYNWDRMGGFVDVADEGWGILL